jgi:hypothetical protein
MNTAENRVKEATKTSLSICKIQMIRVFIVILSFLKSESDYANVKSFTTSTFHDIFCAFLVLKGHKRSKALMGRYETQVGTQ